MCHTIISRSLHADFPLPVVVQVGLVAARIRVAPHVDDLRVLDEFNVTISVEIIPAGGVHVGAVSEDVVIDAEH